MTGFLILPSGLIHAHGFASLSMQEMKLFYRIAGALAVDGLPESADGTGYTAKIEASTLWEAGEADSFRLRERVRNIGNVSFEGNTDGRDKSGVEWLHIRLFGEASIESGFLEVHVGPKMYAIIRNRATFARLKEAVLFNMRDSKYSSKLYALLRDKMNMKSRSWELDVAEFRRLMQVSETAYKSFVGLRRKVIEPAIEELNKKSEFAVKWEKGVTWKNQVKTIVLSWAVRSSEEIKYTEKQLKRAKVAQFKEQQDDSAPPLAERSLYEKAVWRLLRMDTQERIEWGNRAVALGFPKEQFHAAPTESAVRPWASWVMGEMKEKGLLGPTR